MTLDQRIAAAKQLIAQREDIDRQLHELFAGVIVPKKKSVCSTCGQEGHNAKTCPTKSESKLPVTDTV